MKKNFKILFLIILILIVTGCSTSPTYYKREDVIKYVSSVYGEDYILEKIDTKENKEESLPYYEYTFKHKKRNFTFVVTTSTNNVNFLGSETAFYEKYLYDNYISSNYEKHKSTLTNYTKDLSFDVDLSNLSAKIYLNEYTEIKDAAALIVKMDKLLNLEYNYDNWKGTNTTLNRYSIDIYLKPTRSTIEDFSAWKDNYYSYRISSLDLSNSKEYRLKQQAIYEYIEYDLVDKVKEQTSPYYELPEDLLKKYPAKKIAITNIGEQTVTDYYFNYDKKTSQYWIYNLDPCQDNDEFPYNYIDKGTFRKLVEYLGGTYSSKDLTAKYTLNNNTYRMRLVLDTKNYYQNLKVTKNSKTIKLSDPQGKTNKTISGRAYTVQDIERLLDVKVTINQDTRTASLTLKKDD